MVVGHFVKKPEHQFFGCDEPTFAISGGCAAIVHYTPSNEVGVSLRHGNFQFNEMAQRYVRLILLVSKEKLHVICIKRLITKMVQFIFSIQ